MPNKIVPFYREWEGKEEAPIDVEVGSSVNPVDLEAWLDAATPHGKAPVRNDELVKEKGPVFECSICLETVFMPVMPLCMHPFCYGCLYQWFLKTLKCPYCTRAVKAAPIRDNGFEMGLADAIGAGLEKNPNQMDWALPTLNTWHSELHTIPPQFIFSHMPSLYKHVLQSLFEFLDSSSNALADAQLYHGYSWEIEDYRTSYATEERNYGTFLPREKAPMLFDVFGVVRGTSKDGLIVLGMPRWHSEGSAGSTLTVKYHQQLAAISRGLDGLHVPAFLVADMYHRTRRQCLHAYLQNLKTRPNKLSDAGDHPNWSDIDGGWRAITDLGGDKVLCVWGIWRGETTDGVYRLTKPKWRKFGSVGRELELEYDKQHVALSRCIEEVGIGASHDDDDIFLQPSHQATFLEGSVISAVATFTLLDDLSVGYTSYRNYGLYGLGSLSEAPFSAFSFPITARTMTSPVPISEIVTGGQYGTKRLDDEAIEVASDYASDSELTEEGQMDDIGFAIDYEIESSGSGSEIEDGSEEGSLDGFIVADIEDEDEDDLPLEEWTDEESIDDGQPVPTTYWCLIILEPHNARSRQLFSTTTTRYFECSPPEYLLQLAFHDVALREKIRNWITSRDFRLGADPSHSRTPFCVLPDADFDALFASFDFVTRFRLAAACKILAYRATLFYHHELACAIGAWGLNLMEVRYLQLATHTLLAGYPIVATVHGGTPHEDSFLDFFTAASDSLLVRTFLAVTGGYLFASDAQGFRDFDLWVGRRGSMVVRVFGAHIEPERLILRGAPSSSHMVFCDISRLLYPYGDLALARIDLMTPKRCPIEASLKGHVDMWAFLKEIEENGFEWQKAPEIGHCCGSDFSCPCTPRRLDDAGVLTIRMPTLDILFGSLLHERSLKRSWVFYGSGCAEDVESAEDDEQWERILLRLDLLESPPVVYTEYDG
ncbi:hypothetical protein C8R43DRAFT_950858 [Mycena crocata]|nr:hypothetical protein C8R43DRAFT_950858 [Mycena crocata]